MCCAGEPKPNSTQTLQPTWTKHHREGSVGPDVLMPAGYLCALIKCNDTYMFNTCSQQPAKTETVVVAYGPSPLPALKLDPASRPN